MSRDCLACVDATPLSRNRTLSNPKKSRYLNWVLNLAHATGHLPRWCSHISEFEFDVLHCTGIKHQVDNVLSHLQTTDTDTKSMKGDLLIAVMDANTTESTRARLENYQQSLAKENADNDYLKKEAAPKNAEFLKHQTTSPCCRYATQSVCTVNAEYEVIENGLAARVAPVDDAVQIHVPHTLRMRLLHHSHYPVMTGYPGNRRM